MANDAAPTAAIKVGIIMGSQSDWQTMLHAAETLGALGVAHETRIVSAHRTPDRLVDYARSAAALTALPVLGVPVESRQLKGIDSLLSIVQMPAGVPVGTFAIGKSGAVNAALQAAAILALNDPALALRLAAWRQAQTDAVADVPSDSLP